MEVEKTKEQKLSENRIKNPVEYLKGCKVGKRFLNCSLNNFKGNIEPIKQWLDSEKTENFLINSVGSGNGKTHLATALMLELGQKYPVVMDDKKPDSVFLNFSDLMLEIRDSFGKNGTEQGERDIIKKYSYVPYLVIDDIGSEKVSDYSSSILYLILNKRYENMRPVIMTTNMTSQEITAVYGSRIVSRIASGVVYKIIGEDQRV